MYLRYNQDGTLDKSRSPSGTYEGQVCRINYPDGTNEYFGYNDAGELAWHRKQDGTIVTITSRDALHRITQISYPASQGNAAFSVSTAYDEFGRVTSATDSAGTTMAVYDVLNRLTSVTPPAPQKSLTYSYTPDTALERWSTTVTVAGVGSYVYQADTKGRLAAVVNPFSRTFSLQYDPDGKNTVVTYPNGEQEQRGYTTRDWLASLTVGPPGAAVDSFSYLYTDTLGHYDPTGHLRQEVDAGSRAHVFSYDNLYQLVQESHPDFGTIGYGYDLNGNRTSKTTSGGTDYYGVDAANKLLWVNRGTNAAPTSGQVSPYTLFGYDLNGNVTSRERRDDSGLLRSYSFSWDGDNRLRSVNEGTTNRFTATYDGSGTRISKTDSWTGAHNYSWGPDGLVYDSAGNTIYTPGLSQQVGGVDGYPLHDWQGSTRYLTDSSQGVDSALRFDAYGNRSLTGGTDPYDPSDFQFGAGWGYQTEYANGVAEPGLGLQLLGERYYDPAVGRFISQDPIRFVGGLNLYQYCGNDTVNCVDPSGLAADEDPFEPRGDEDFIDPDIARFLYLWRQAQEERFQEILRENGITPEGFRAGVTAAVRDFLADTYRQDLGLLPCDQVERGLLPDPALLEEEGVGPYNRVGGHHIHAQSAFDQDPNYSRGKMLSISQEFMEENDLNHRAMTTQQRRSFRALAASGEPNTMEEHSRIAAEALRAGGMKDEGLIQSLVEKSVAFLNELGIKAPSRIPRFGR